MRDRNGPPSSPHPGFPVARAGRIEKFALREQPAAAAAGPLDEGA